MSLALQPALADDLFGNHPLTPEARDAFVTELLKKMTVDEKIGQLRLISVGPDNPKEAIREMIKDGQVGAIFNTVTRQDIRAAAEAFGAVTVDYCKDSIMLRLTDISRKIDDFIDLMRDFEILEICRTGSVSLEKGSTTIRQTINL